jgi:hypothetical protein
VRNPPRNPARDLHSSYNQYPGYEQLARVANLYPPQWRAELVVRLAAPTSSTTTLTACSPVLASLTPSTRTACPDRPGVTGPGTPAGSRLGSCLPGRGNGAAG